MTGGQAHGARAPGKHEDGDPSRRSQFLEQDIGGDLEEAVGDEEDEQCVDELIAAHAGLGEQVISGGVIQDLGISDVCAVEET